jgi:hypothetical protein
MATQFFLQMKMEPFIVRLTMARRGIKLYKLIFSIIALPSITGQIAGIITIGSTDRAIITTTIQVAANGVQSTVNTCTSLFTNDQFFSPVHHRFTSGDIHGVLSRLLTPQKPPAQWHLCDPDNPGADISALDAWSEFGYTGDSRIGIGIVELS